MKRLALLLTGVALAVCVLAVPASAADELGLSSDGTTWAGSLPQPLFDPAFRWVPGDSETASFYVRNQSPDAGVLDLNLVTGPVEDLISSGEISVSAQLDGGAFTSVDTAGEHLLIDRAQLASGVVHKVTVRVDFDSTAVNPSQQRELDLRFSATLSQDASVLPPTDGGNGGNGGSVAGPEAGGDLPNTGTAISLTFVLLAALLLAAGVGLVGYSRRNPIFLEERYDHAQD